MTKGRKKRTTDGWMEGKEEGGIKQVPTPPTEGQVVDGDVRYAITKATDPPPPPKPPTVETAGVLCGSPREAKSISPHRKPASIIIVACWLGRHHAGLLRGRAATNVLSRCGDGERGRVERRSPPVPSTKKPEHSNRARRGRSSKARTHAAHMRRPHGDEGKRKEARATASKRTEGVKEGAGRRWEITEHQQNRTILARSYKAIGLQGSSGQTKTHQADGV
ncbi:hypothetical protein C8J57DRAFT_1229221 [Mycena rebaudengoi]|nr:hypothetical protein C8J57DRAFT_1229221 [Mycena rebaudengoi]